MKSTFELDEHLVERARLATGIHEESLLVETGLRALIERVAEAAENQGALAERLKRAYADQDDQEADFRHRAFRDTSERSPW